MESENEEDRAFIDDESVHDAKESQSPVHDSELDVDEDDLLLIEDHLEEEEHKAALHRAKRFKAGNRRKVLQESSSDETSRDGCKSTCESQNDSRDSMADFIVEDSPPVKPMRHGRRPLESMSNFTNFRPMKAEAEPRSQTWGFMMAKPQKPPLPPAKTREHGYVRVEGALMYRKRDGTLKPATGVDSF